MDMERWEDGGTKERNRDGSSAVFIDGWMGGWAQKTIQEARKGDVEEKKKKQNPSSPFHEIVLPLVSERQETMARSDLCTDRIVLFLDGVVVTAYCVQGVVQLRRKQAGVCSVNGCGRGGERIHTVGVEDTCFESRMFRMVLCSEYR